jgi:hypothetical protein
MATKAAVNPIYFKGPLLQKEKRRAKDGITWKAGHPVRLSDSGIVKCKALATAVYGLTSEDQLSATSSSDVWIEKIPSAQTQFIMSCFKESAGTDTKCPITNIGKKKGLGISDCIGGVALSADTVAAIIKIHKRITDVEAYRNDTSDVPGLVIASFVDSALTNEGAGM